MVFSVILVLIYSAETDIIPMNLHLTLPTTKSFSFWLVSPHCLRPHRVAVPTLLHVPFDTHTLYLGSVYILGIFYNPCFSHFITRSLLSFYVCLFCVFSWSCVCFCLQCTPHDASLCKCMRMWRKGYRFPLRNVCTLNRSVYLWTLFSIVNKWRDSLLTPLSGSKEPIPYGWRWIWGWILLKGTLRRNARWYIFFSFRFSE